jgi:HlyD family secretion protein
MTSRDPADDIRTRLEMTPRAIRRWRALRWLSWLVVVALLAAAVGAVSRGLRTEPTAEYQTSAVVRGPLTVTVTATGELKSFGQVQVGTEISGIVETVNADFNDQVKAGDVLAVINTDKLQAQAQQARASLQSTRADVMSAEAALDETRKSLERARALATDSLIAQSDLDAAEAGARRANASHASAVARVAQAEATLATIESDLGKADIRSPITGIVLDRQVDPGQTVAASFQTPVLFTLSDDLTRMTLSVDVDEADVGRVQAGQAATFRVDAYPDRTFASQVTDLRNTPNTSNGVVTYETILTADNAERLLRPGMTATAEITVTRIEDAVLVPNAALRFAPPASAQPGGGGGRGRGPLFFLPPPPGLRGRGPSQAPGGPRVWILEGSELVPVDLTAGPSDGTYTVVTSGNLSPGAQAIVDVVVG